MIIKFKEFGSSLGTRHLGKIAKVELDAMFNESEELITLDFKDVSLVTNSFADEVFGKKILEIGFSEFKRRTTFLDINPFIWMIVQKAIKHRVEELEKENA